MTNKFSDKARVISVLANRPVSQWKNIITQLSVKKKLLASVAVVGGISLFFTPLLFTQAHQSNQQKEDNSGQESAAAHADESLKSETEKQAESETNTGEQAGTEKNIATQGSSSSSVNIQSSVSSNNGVVTETHVQSETSDGERRETITKQSDDGQSKVTYRVELDGGSESTMKVRDRNGRLKIDIDEKKEIE